MNPARTAACSALAALVLVASVWVTAAPAGAAIVTIGTHPTTMEETAVDGTITMRDDDGWVAIMNEGVPSNVIGGTVTYSFDPAERYSTTEVQISYRFTPAPQFHGTASFRFEANDGGGRVYSHTETVTVTPVDDPPTWDSPSHTTGEGQPVSGSVTFQDPDSTFSDGSIQTQAAHGTAVATSVTGSGTGTMVVAYTYTPNAGFDGTDSFVVGHSSGVALPGPTVQVTVEPNAAPTAGDISETTDEEVPVTISLDGHVSDANDTSFTYSTSTPPSHGTLEIAGSDATYTPDPDHFGTDSFRYQACDDQASCATGNATITIVGTPDEPVVTGVHPTIAEGSDTGTLTVTAVDPDGGALIAPTVTAQPSNGALTVVDAGTGPPSFLSYAYAPDAGFNGTDTFQITFADDNGGVTVHTETITVTAVNDGPVARDSTLILDEDGSATVNLLDQVADPDDPHGDLTFRIARDAAHGSPALVAGMLSYAPDADWSGTDTVTFQVCDPTGQCDTGTVTYTVRPVNDPPTAGAGGFGGGDQEVEVGTRVTLAADEITDPEGGVVTYSWTQTAGPVVELAGATTRRATFVASEAGAYRFAVTACDAEGLCIDDDVAVDVHAAAQEPAPAAPGVPAPPPLAPVTDRTPPASGAPVAPGAPVTLTTGGAAPASLPRTGGSLAGLAGGALLLLLAGALVGAEARRRTA